MYLKSVLRMGSLMLHFRNGLPLVQQMRAGQPCDEAVLWDGTRITHPPGRGGLLETLQEIWVERIYTREFYRPAAGDMVVDAGANVGIFAIHIARQNSRGRVLALEPFAENFRYLQENVARARLDNVRCCQIALGSGFGKGQMQAVGRRSLDHVLRLEYRSSNVRVCSSLLQESGEVSVVPLSGLFELAGAEEIAFLKVDIEGSERDVFAAAAPDVLRRIKRVAMEYHDGIMPGTLDVLRKALAATHDTTVRPSRQEGCGILLARRGDLKN